jgi:mannose-6-phosphate isomerase-like protein (cupin superfamily)
MPARAGGADPHFHRTFSEAFLVIAGSVALYDGDRWREARFGDFVYVPEGGVHGFRNDADEASSMLILFAPGAPRERYFEGLVEAAAMSQRPSPEEMAEFFREHDTFWL